jgi:hypothetical protein
MFGIKKQRNKARMANVRRKGKAGENAAKAYLGTWGKVERTGRGHDFKFTTEHPISGKKKTKYVEVKTGRKAKQSKLQKATQKKMGRKYKVLRINARSSLL